MMLEVNIYKESNLLYRCNCLNEMVAKSNTSNMIKLSISVDQEEMEPYRGDGIIISTPTGSTAYSLSCGGPVVEPGLEAILLTPIASYKTSKRPMVIHPQRTINLVPLQYQSAVISIDGQVNIDFKQNYQIKIRKAPARLKLAVINQRPFYTLVDRRGK
jgi:NAD+ kinase